MVEIIVYVIGCLGAGLAGYALRAIQHPTQKRGKNGRFTKN